MRIIGKILIALLIAAAPLAANDVYLAQSAQGANNGADCADALTVSYFNTSGNWTSGVPSGTQIGPGTTVHLCSNGGNITTALSFQGSGASGSVVTLKFESGAALTSPTAWPTTGAISTNSKSYLLIEGNSTGVISNAANGSALANHLSTTAINVLGSHDVEVRNFKGSGGIHNLYVNGGEIAVTSISVAGGVATVTCATACNLSTGAAFAILGNSNSLLNWQSTAWSSATSYNTGNTVNYQNSTYTSLVNGNLNNVPPNTPTDWQLNSTFTINGGTTTSPTFGTTATSGGTGGTISDEDAVSNGILLSSLPAGTLNLSIHDTVLDNARLGIQLQYPTGATTSAVSIYNNSLSNTNKAIVIGDSWVNAIFSGLAIYGNTIGPSVIWDDVSNSNHHTAMHFYAASSGSSLQGITAYDNIVSGNPGVNQTSFGFYSENVHGSSGCGGALFYNNRFDATTGQASASIIQPKNSTYECFYNNTIVCQSGTGSAFTMNSTTSNIDIRNNVVSGCGTGVNETGSTSDIATTSNTNVYYGLSGNPFYYHGSAVTLAAWRTDCGCDAASSTGDPKLDASDHLQAGSSAIASSLNGANLSSLFTTDMAGLPRPPVGPWDAGAYMYAVSGGGGAATGVTAARVILSGVIVP